MKGGKAGRRRKASASGKEKPGARREIPRTGKARRPEGVAPKKGSRKNPYGGTSTSGDE